MRSVRFGLVLTEAEKRALVRLAEAEGGRSRAAVVRRLIRREAHRRGLWAMVREERQEEVQREQ